MLHCICTIRTFLFANCWTDVFSKLKHVLLREVCGSETQGSKETHKGQETQQASWFTGHKVIPAARKLLEERRLPLPESWLVHCSREASVRHQPCQSRVLILWGINIGRGSSVVRCQYRMSFSAVRRQYRVWFQYCEASIMQDLGDSGIMKHQLCWGWGWSCGDVATF